MSKSILIFFESMKKIVCAFAAAAFTLSPHAEEEREKINYDSSIEEKGIPAHVGSELPLPQQVRAVLHQRFLLSLPSAVGTDIDKKVEIETLPEVKGKGVFSGVRIGF